MAPVIRTCAQTKHLGIRTKCAFLEVLCGPTFMQGLLTCRHPQCDLMPLSILTGYIPDQLCHFKLRHGGDITQVESRLEMLLRSNRGNRIMASYNCGIAGEIPGYSLQAEPVGGLLGCKLLCLDHRLVFFRTGSCACAFPTHGTFYTKSQILTMSTQIRSRKRQTHTAIPI